MEGVILLRMNICIDLSFHTFTISKRSCVIKMLGFNDLA